MIALIGAKPVFVDIDRSTYNMDASKLEAAITPRTKAIMPVSLYGQCPDIDAINTIACRNELPVIEDAAQSFGATYKGRRSGGMTADRRDVVLSVEAAWLLRRWRRAVHQ